MKPTQKSIQREAKRLCVVANDGNFQIHWQYEGTQIKMCRIARHIMSRISSAYRRGYEAHRRKVAWPKQVRPRLVTFSGGDLKRIRGRKKKGTK